jgi:DNA modification methylase
LKPPVGRNHELFGPSDAAYAPAGNALSASKRANDLNGQEWVRNSISIWSDIRKNAEEEKLKHPAMFPSMLPTRIIQSLTRSDETVVLDPFMGTGSTLVAAYTLGRLGIGIEVYPEFIEIAKRRLLRRHLLPPVSEPPEPVIHQADAREILKYVSLPVNICITSPPYWDILEQKRTADYKQTRRYGEADIDLGRVDDYETFLGALDQVWQGVYQVLVAGAYLAVVVMDLRKKDRFYPYHMDITRHITAIGAPPFILDDIIIWNRQNEYNNLRALGYPSRFRVNKVHEFILIFRKP